MSDKEILEKVTSMLEEMKEIAMGEIDPEKGKTFWPIKEGDCPTINDAYATLYSLSDATLELTFYDETGNTLTDELSVELMDIYATNNIGVFARLPLKKMLEDELQNYIDSDNADCRSARLLARLVKAFEE